MVGSCYCPEIFQTNAWNGRNGPSPDFTENLGINENDIAEATKTWLVTSYVKRVCRFMGMDPTESDTAASAFDKEKSTEVLKTETITINKKGRPYTVTQRLPRDASKHYVLNLEEIPVTCSTVLVQCSQHGKSLQYLGNTCEKNEKNQSH